MVFRMLIQGARMILPVKASNVHRMVAALVLWNALFLVAGCGGGGRGGALDATAVHTSHAATEGSVSFQLDAWADNWFAAYLGENLLVEDSVPITTERSFNAETVTFDADYPLHLNFVLKDYKENDTGLEYIGERNQQMGDGGFVMQLTDTGSGEVVAVTNGGWACTVIHHAPSDKSCEDASDPVAGEGVCDFVSLDEPAGWKSDSFDDRGWNDVTVHTASDVRPRDGYDRIAWDSGAELIWGPDLETDNTILCRMTVNSP